MNDEPGGDVKSPFVVNDECANNVNTATLRSALIVAFLCADTPPAKVFEPLAEQLDPGEVSVREPVLGRS
jgi:hypothetical protein